MSSKDQSFSDNSHILPTPRTNNDAQPSPVVSASHDPTDGSPPSLGRSQRHSASYQWKGRPSTPNELTNSVVRTVVSSGNDALNLLFEAAAHEGGNTASMDQSTPRPSQDSATAQETSPYNVFPSSGSFSASQPGPSPVKISSSSHSVLRVWEACRFVRMGWFSAREAVTYIDTYVLILLFPTRNTFMSSS